MNLGETKKLHLKKRENYLRIMFKNKNLKGEKSEVALFQRVSADPTRSKPKKKNFFSLSVCFPQEEEFSKEIIPNPNTIYQSLLHRSTENNFVI